MSNQELTPGDVRRAEALVTRIRGVSACRIALDRSGAIAEIHVIADGSKSPKLVARDVESCLKAELGVAVDYRKIGVVVVEAEPEPVEAPDAGGEATSTGEAGVSEAGEAAAAAAGGEAAPAGGSNAGARTVSPRPTRPATGATDRPSTLGRDEDTRDGGAEARSAGAPGARETARGEEAAAPGAGAAARRAAHETRAGERGAPGGAAQPHAREADARREPAPADEIVELPVEEYASRFAFQSVHVSATREGLRAEVELERDGAVVFGAAQSENTAQEPWEAIAEATLRAVAELLDARVRLCLSDVRRVTLGDGEAFVVRVDLIEPRSVRPLAGCAMVTGNLNQSVVFAALDAVNRVAGRLDFGSSVEYRIR